MACAIERSVRPRLKQHPGNQALLSQFMKEIFVIRNDKLHLINP